MANYPFTNYGYQPQFTTNKIYVTSPEDALSRFASYNTIMVYFLQDESTLFEVTTDAQGKKYLKTRKLTDIEPVTQQNAQFVTREEFDGLKAKIDGLTKSKKVGKDDAE